MKITLIKFYFEEELMGKKRLKLTNQLINKYWILFSISHNMLTKKNFFCIKIKATSGS